MNRLFSAEAHYQQTLVLCSSDTLCLLMEVCQFKRVIRSLETLFTIMSAKNCADETNYKTARLEAVCASGASVWLQPKHFPLELITGYGSGVAGCTTEDWKPREFYYDQFKLRCVFLFSKVSKHLFFIFILLMQLMQQLSRNPKLLLVIRLEPHVWVLVLKGYNSYYFMIRNLVISPEEPPQLTVPCCCSVNRAGCCVNLRCQSNFMPGKVFYLSE